VIIIRSIDASGLLEYYLNGKDNSDITIPSIEVVPMTDRGNDLQKWVKEFDYVEVQITPSTYS
jgi:hypothetical protein